MSWSSLLRKSLDLLVLSAAFKNDSGDPGNFDVGSPIKDMRLFLTAVDWQRCEWLTARFCDHRVRWWFVAIGRAGLPMRGTVLP